MLHMVSVRRSQQGADPLAVHEIKLCEGVFPFPSIPQALTFPWPLRFRLAVDRALLGKLLGIFLRTVFAWQRQRPRLSRPPSTARPCTPERPALEVKCLSKFLCALMPTATTLVEDS